jgi:hypothetical protein
MKKALLFSAAAIGSLATVPMDVKFPSLGETVAGSLYLPVGNGPFPAVITGPGLLVSRRCLFQIMHRLSPTLALRL